MKRQTIYLVGLVALLAGVAAWLMLRNNGSSLRQELRDFAVKDTGAVTRIFLADKNNHSILLDRASDAEWTLNRMETARQSGINQLLATLKQVSVRTRVPKSHYNLTVKNLAATGIKCEIYLDDTTKPYKTYYVGGPTQDNVGTYMMLEESSVPFVTEIPGFNGYLTPRYSVEVDDWRDRIVFAETPSEITSVSIDYPAAPGHSFRIERRAGQFTVVPGDGRPELRLPDTVAILNYLDFFKMLPFESWDREYSLAQRDSLSAVQPLAIIRVGEPSGMTTAVLHHKPVNERSLVQQDERGNPVDYDVDRMYAFIRDGKELVVVQYFSFGKVLRKLDDFNLEKRPR